MLLQRLKDHRTMADGIVWSAQADFQARLADWETESDPLWPLQRAERAALLALNVPHFVMPTDGSEIRDAGGACTRTEVVSGLDRARARVRRLDEQNVAWQIEVIRQNTGTLSSSRPTSGSECMQRLRTEEPIAPAKGIFIAEADAVAAELSQHAFRRGQTAAWIGREWLGDSEVSQLVALGQDLYNGLCGIALFLAAHACVMRNQVSQELALAAVCHMRKNLKSRNSARMARSLGIGGATGLGSVVYALTTMSNCLRDEELLADAHVAAELFTDDLIEADQHLDVVGGSAGAILGLLRLHRDTGSDDVLRRAIKCGVHLLARPRVGPTGCRSWRSRGSALQPLNGMSHGAAGFAYALFALAASTGRDEFAHAASECIAFENASYDAARGNWPDLRNGGEAEWPLKWCHGAPGVGLARIGASKTGGLDRSLVAADIANALAGSEQAWPGEVDSLCCGTLGHTELIADAGSALGRSDLRELASRRLMAIVQTAARNGDYRWAVGTKQFNLGLFHGLAGVGYTCLRRVDPSLPNVLIWE